MIFLKPKEPFRILVCNASFKVTIDTLAPKLKAQFTNKSL